MIGVLIVIISHNVEINWTRFDRYEASCLCCNIIFIVLFSQSAPPLIGRYVPFAAVAAANCVNIPLMRQT